MNFLQNVKILGVTPPAAIVDDAAFTTGSIDTQGYSRLKVIILFGAMDIAMAALKLQMSDTDGSYADVEGADFSVSPATLPSATSDNTIFTIDVDLKGKKRFYDLSATGGNGTAGTYMTVIAILSNGDKTPTSVTEMGVAQALVV